MNQNVLTITLHPAVDHVFSVKKLIPGEPVIGETLLRVPSGKGVNTARSLQCLFQSAGISSFRLQTLAWVGADQSEFFRNELLKQGITSLLPIRQANTRLGLSFVDQSNRKTTHVRSTMSKPTPAEEELLLAEAQRSINKGWTAFCGSAPDKTKSSLLRTLLSLPKEKGGKSICDSNGDLLHAAAHAGITILKGNSQEIGNWLFLKSKPIDYKKHAKQIQKKLSAKNAPEEIIVTLGKEGALLVRKDIILYANAPRLVKVKQQGTVGCGDAATAGRIWAGLQKCSPEDALRWTVACGSAKLAVDDPGSFNPRYAKILFNKIKVGTQ